MSPSSSRGRAPLSRDPLTPQRVVDTALELLRTDGLGGLTVRGLAAKLGVAVTAIYWHVGDKQALLDAVVDRIVGELGEVRAVGDTPAERLVSLGAALHENLHGQGHLVGVVHQQGRTAELFHPAQRVVAEELAAAGLHGEEAARTVHGFLRLVSGAVVLERSVERAPVQRETPEELWARDEIAGDPALSEALAQPIDAEAVFAFSLETYVRGLLAGAQQDLSGRSGGSAGRPVGSSHGQTEEEGRQQHARRKSRGSRRQEAAQQGAQEQRQAEVAASRRRPR